MIDISLNIANLQRDLRRQGFQLYLADRYIDTVSVVTDMTLTAAPMGSLHSTPAMLSDSAVQCLMDDLWHAGIRPVNNRDTEGEVEFLRKQIDRIISTEWRDE